MEDKSQYLPPFLTLQLLTKIRIITSALQDERDDEILFILEMLQQGSVEALDLSGKPFGHAQRVTVAARHFAGKRSNEVTARGAEAIDSAVDHPVVIVENVEALFAALAQLRRRWGNSGHPQHDGAYPALRVALSRAYDLYRLSVRAAAPIREVLAS
jgi:hypothetical protein